MGIESDRLVYDYLSRVGDLAQQRQLSAAERMWLVAELRSQIDERRAKAPDSPTAVKRILGRLGTPDEIVAAAGDGTPRAGGAAGQGLFVPAAREAPEGPLGRGRLSRRRSASSAEHGPDTVRGGARPGPSSDGPSPPHLAGEDELGPRDAAPDWWRMEPGPFGGTGTSVPGFVGGIEIPEILRPPRTRDGEKPPAAGAAAGGDAEKAAGDGKDPGAEGRGAGLLRRVFSRRTESAPAVAVRFSPVLLVAAVLLLSGAVMGSVLALALGWLIAYGTRTLSRTETKTAVLGVPGLVAAGTLVWLWGRSDGRWGDPIAPGHTGEVLTGMWPVTLRAAAVASALFLLWRARRPRSQG